MAELAAADDAYRVSLGGQPAPVVAGLTGDQQYLDPKDRVRIW
ncbi:MAG TPA: hypothetical protein VEQ84_20505 [Vicinamibacteria bacterium]|nr:hypothetical protein [Vicinamibacteria bacterium]